MNLQNKVFDTYLQRFIADYPDISFVMSESTYWEPQKRQIHYNRSQTHPIWALMHEIGHMKLRHSIYKNDIELIIMEKDAWNAAKKLSKTYEYPIENDHIEDCLDSYRDWLYKRSLCPNCHQTGIQSEARKYNCLNCRHTWQVSISRFCRSYRRSIKKLPAVS